MPLISEFFGIKIYMHWADHLPMHFHAQYGSTQAIISIEQVAVIKGILPAKQLKLGVKYTNKSLLKTGSLLKKMIK